jgi:hypothetical protein
MTAGDILIVIEMRPDHYTTKAEKRKPFFQESQKMYGFSQIGHTGILTRAPLPI